jgi:predicted lipase
MCSAIRAKVAEIKAKIDLRPDYNGRIPLYIAGHSLGGALASLFYYRLRKGHDLDDICDVRDTYVYGCPGVGDTDFAMGYARYHKTNVLRANRAVIHVFLITPLQLCGGSSMTLIWWREFLSRLVRFSMEVLETRTIFL